MKRPTVTMMIGDCRRMLTRLPNGSVHCIVTSPPYFGLRDYGVAGQIGLEPTPAAYVNELVNVLGEARRVLRDDGTLWLNLGDSYGTGASGQNFDPASGATNQGGRGAAGAFGHKKQPPVRGFYKNLLGIPWRVAFALQADGWYLRQDIIWSKPNPMPESVIDRCTRAHEYIFLLSKRQHYYFDAAAISEPARYAPGCGWQDAGHEIARKTILTKNPAFRAIKDRRNKRSVWEVATRPLFEAHFATFPPDLIKPCILAGCPSDGTVLDPFGGSGTTGAVANELGRNSILIELNKQYVALATRRIKSESGLFAPNVRIEK